MNDREPELRGGDERLADWVDGRMSDRDRERFLAEMRVNAQLKQDLENYERTVGVLRAALRAPMQPAPIADRVMAAIAAEKCKPVPARATTLSFRSRPLWWSLLSAAALLLVALLVNELPSRPATTTDLVSHDAPAPQPGIEATAAVPAGEPTADAQQELTRKQSGDAQGEVTKSLAGDAGPGGDPKQLDAEKPGEAKRLLEGDVSRTAPAGGATEDRKEAKSPPPPGAATELVEGIGAELGAQGAEKSSVQKPVGNPPPESTPTGESAADRDKRAPFSRGSASGAKDKAAGELADDPVAAGKSNPTGGGGGGGAADPTAPVAGAGRAGGEAPAATARPDSWGDLGGTNADQYKNKDKPEAEKAAPLSGRGGGRRGGQTAAGRALAMVLVEGVVEPTEVPSTGGLRKATPTDDAPADPLQRDVAKNSSAYRAQTEATPLDEAGLRAAVQGFLRTAAVAGADAMTAAFPTARGPVAVSPLLDTSIEFDAPVSAAAAEKLAFDRTWVVEGARGEVAIVLQEISLWSQERKFTLRSGESKPTASVPPLPTPAAGKSGPAVGEPAPFGPATGGPAGPAAPAPVSVPTPKPSSAPGAFVDNRLAERAQVVFRVRLHGR